MLQPGAPIPRLTAQDAHGAPVSSETWLGNRLVLYFYPKDDTPSCTMEACSFRDNVAPIRARGAEIVGVSPDSPASHEAFARKYDLPFTLLSDTDGAIAQAFGTAVDQLWAGKTFKSVSRSTLLIDEEGIIRKVWEAVDPRNHVQQVVEALEALDAQAENRNLQERLQEARQITDRPIESPFANARLAEARLAAARIAEGHVPEAHQTEASADGSADPEQVQGVLDTLRPYMQADGGDVELVGIEAGIVKVRLHGACGTCPSSTVTLKLGLEAQLKRRVPGILGVEAVF